VVLAVGRRRAVTGVESHIGWEGGLLFCWQPSYPRSRRFMKAAVRRRRLVCDVDMELERYEGS